MLYITLVLGLVLSFAFKDQLKATRIYTALLVLLSAFRFGIGADYFAYQYLYRQVYIDVIEEIKYGRQKQEVGFRAIGSILKSFGATYQIYLAILGLVTLFFIYKISTKYSKNPILTMTAYYAFYYFVWTLSSLRQGLAMAIGMFFLLEAINHKKRITFFIVSAFLFFIHSSSLILVLIYFLAKYVPWTRKRIMIFIGISVLFSSLPATEIVTYLSQYSEIFERTLNYIDSGFTLTKLFSLQSIARIGLIGIVLYFYTELVEDSPAMKNIVHIYLISFMFYFVFQFSELTAARLSIYGRILDMVILPSIIYLKLPKTLNKKALATGLVLFICIYFLKEVNTMKIQSGLVTKEDYVVTYSSIFNKNDRYYNTRYYYVLYYGATEGFPKNFHMIQ